MNEYDKMKIKNQKDFESNFKLGDIIQQVWHTPELKSPLLIIVEIGDGYFMGKDVYQLNHTMPEYFIAKEWKLIYDSKGEYTQNFVECYHSRRNGEFMESLTPYVRNLMEKYNARKNKLK